MRRIIALMLAGITSFSILASCSDAGEPLDSSFDANITEESVADKETEPETEAILTTDTESEETESDTLADSTETESETESETETETEAETRPQIIRDYTIVYALYSGTGAQSGVEKLRSAISTHCKKDFLAQKENYYESQHPNMSGNKIVVGHIEKDPVAMQIYESLHTELSYIIKYVDGSLYIIGGCGEATETAVDYFIKTYVSKYKILTFDFFTNKFLIEKNELPIFKDMTIAGNPLENYVIVHDGSHVSKLYANEMRSVINRKTGKTLPIKISTAGEYDYEILVGKTDRAESKSVVNGYDRHNVYYTAKTVGSSLVLMGEGWYSLKRLTAEFTAMFDTLDPSKCNLSGTILSGDVIKDIDAEGMLTRASKTDLRVLNFNIYGATYNFQDWTFFENNVERGEFVGDMLLAYAPDVITTNELYRNSGTLSGIMYQISDYYTLIESPYDDGYPFDNSTSGGLANPEQIFIKKSCNFKVIDSGWRYLSEGGKGNPVTYHGIHWAVLQNTAGKKFIVSVGHYGESNSTDVYAREHKAAIDMAQASSGSKTALPVIAAGDFFSRVGSGKAYLYHTDTCKLIDPQRDASINVNGSIKQATCHGFGKNADNGTRYDFILHSDKFKALKFKVLKSEELLYASDHYPVCVDLKFK